MLARVRELFDLYFPGRQARLRAEALAAFNIPPSTVRSVAIGRRPLWGAVSQHALLGALRALKYNPYRRG